MDIPALLKTIPERPGIYLMKDPDGRVIYVGKAVSLRRRVRSYFQKDFSGSPRTAAMVSQIRDLEWRPAGSDSAALLMESNAIKRLKPHYNVRLTDDKSYPYLRITAEEYPRVEAVRRPYHGRGDAFGPFQPGTMRETLEVIRELFPLRYCEGPLRGKKPCLYFEMKRCLGPCIPGRVSTAEYGEAVRQLRLFLSGRKSDLLETLQRRMRGESDRQHFEEAARLRDRIASARRFFVQHRESGRLRRQEGEMADRPGREQGLRELQQACGLPVLPRHIEAFDTSTFQGTDSTASLVCFRNGVPCKRDYRKFRIRTVAGVDDFAMMGEAVERRYRRILNEKAPLPDLVLVDGGRGQLSRTQDVLRKLGLERIPVISLAKREEEVFIPERPQAVRLPRRSAALHLVQWIRDEAHRFAVRYHRVLRDRRTVSSALDRLPGIGAKRKLALLKRFGSIDGIRNAAPAEIAAIPGFSLRRAQQVRVALSLKTRDEGRVTAVTRDEYGSKGTSEKIKSSPVTSTGLPPRP